MAEPLPFGSPARPSAWALAGQFFLIPLGIVAVCASLYAFIRFISSAEDRTPSDWVRMVRESGRHARTHAAHQLAISLKESPEAAKEPGLAGQILDAYEQVAKDGVLPKDEQAAILCTLVQCVGLTRDATAVGRLGTLLDDAPDDSVRTCCMDAMGAIQDARAGDTLVRFLDDASPLLRKYAVFNLAALCDPSRLDAIKGKLHLDEAIDVRWNAAIGLAIFHGDASGADVIRTMLDNDTMTRSTRNDADPELGRRNKHHAMRMAIVAAASLRDASMGPALDALQKTEAVDLSVREAARGALREIQGGAK